jgi:hypothetical protein
MFQYRFRNIKFMNYGDKYREDSGMFHIDADSTPILTSRQLNGAHTFVGYRILLSLLQAGYNVRAMFPLDLYRSINLTEYRDQLQIIPNGGYWANFKVSEAHLDGIAAVVYIDYPPPSALQPVFKHFLMFENKKANIFIVRRVSSTANCLRSHR